MECSCHTVSYGKQLNYCTLLLIANSSIPYSVLANPKLAWRQWRWREAGP
jgi:hypothetical protein